VLSDFAERIGSKFVHFVPRSPVIQACEVESKTVIELSPDSVEAGGFREMAQKVMSSGTPTIPTPLEELTELEELYRRHLEN
jgi:nitrogenase iron protein NifH